jgi:multiple sugar transport system permease protein
VLKPKKSFVFFFYISATIIVGMWLVPFLITTFTSLKTMNELMATRTAWAPPAQIYTGNFREAWEVSGMQRYFGNTFIITIPSVVGTLLISSLSAFALAFYQFRFSRAVLILFVGGMLIPFQMLLIPVFRFSNQVGLYDTYQGVILFHVAFQLGFCTFFLRNFMKTIPSSLYESARIDGARDFTIYRKIVMPLTVPAMAALGILQFTWIWNDYLWSLILLQSDHYKPVTLGLVTLRGQWIASWNLIAAGSLIAAIVPLTVFLIFQRYFIEGLTVGAVKG